MSWDSHHPSPDAIRRVILAGLRERALHYRQLQGKGPAYRTQGRQALGSEATLCENVAAMVQAADLRQLAEVLGQAQPAAPRGPAEIQAGIEEAGQAIAGGDEAIAEYLLDPEMSREQREKVVPPRGCGSHHAGECTSEFPYNQREG